MDFNLISKRATNFLGVNKSIIIYYNNLIKYTNNFFEKMYSVGLYKISNEVLLNDSC
jgi:hypothetical protein